MPFVMHTGTVFVFSEEGSDQVVQSGKDVLAPQPQLLEVPFSKAVPSLSSMRRQADEHMHRQHQISMPPCVLDPSVFVRYTLTARPSAADVLAAELLAVAASDERSTLNVAVLFLSTPDKPTSEASQYQAVYVSRLSASDMIELGQLNFTSPVPLNHTAG